MTEAVSSTGAAYIIKLANDAPEEAERLDDMYNGVKDYLEGALSFAPLEDTAPKAILELGSGSGAWAIQAANQFPNAEVLAMDITPMPPRPNPPPENLKFRAHDLVLPFPFEPESFDIIHARFVFIHLPKFEDVLTRVVILVKPGGWLLLDDLEATVYAEEGLSPNQKAFWEAYHEHQRRQGIDSFAPAAFEAALRGSNSFEEVHVHKVAVPFSATSGDVKLDRIGLAMRESIHRGNQQVSENPLISDISRELGERSRAELRDPQYKFYANVYFTWSRKPL